MIELQAAKRKGYIFNIQLLEHDLLVLMSSETTDSKVCEVAEYIGKKFSLYTKPNTRSKSIMVFDVYMLDPKV
jgi:hypothetical protein